MPFPALRRTVMRPLGIAPHETRGFKPMSSIASTVAAPIKPGHNAPAHSEPKHSEPSYQVIRRSGGVTPFDPAKIAIALTKAFLAVEGSSATDSRRIHDIVEQLTAQIVANLTRRAASGRTFHIEDIQDQVELALMRNEHHKVARAYVLYREARAKERATKAIAPAAAPPLRMTTADGTLVPLDDTRLTAVDRKSVV